MILFKKATDLRNYLDAQLEKNNKIGFVPTMGALHKGHISLIETSKKNGDLNLSSIFVNPAQFNDPNDYQKYPINLEKDIYLLESAGCDILFLPSAAEIYPEGLITRPRYELGYLEKVLEGKYRPGHFQGVCMAVQRLLEIVRPARLYLGQKDYQQCMVIRKLIELMGLDKVISLSICPTQREPDGLAMSSRNLRLNPEERKRAVAIYECLFFIKENLKKGGTGLIKTEAAALLQQQGFKVDYVEIAGAADLSPVENWNGDQKIVALVAAHLNEVRLIDNILLN